MSEKEIEKIIDEINGTMAIEDMKLTDEDKENLRCCLRGDVSFEDMRKIIIKQCLASKNCTCKEIDENR